MMNQAGHGELVDLRVVSKLFKLAVSFRLSYASLAQTIFCHLSI